MEERRRVDEDDVGMLAQMHEDLCQSGCADELAWIGRKGPRSQDVEATDVRTPIAVLTSARRWEEESVISHNGNADYRFAERHRSNCNLSEAGLVSESEEGLNRGSA